MISCLPSSPEKCCVSRIDWMISLSLRSAVRVGSWTSSGSSRRWRTSCWVIVEAPRASPRSEPSPAETIATGSKPAFSQKVLSSTAVVASSRTFGISSKVTTSRFALAETRELDLARAVVDDRLLGVDIVREGRGVIEALRQGDIGADRRQREDGADAGEEEEGDDRDVADGRRSGASSRSGSGGGSSGGHGR